MGDAPPDFAGLHPGVAALYRDAEALTWSDLNLRSDRLAAALHIHGVGVGDIVTFVLPNGLDVVIGSFACWRMGAVPQVLSMNLAGDEFRAIIDLADPQVVFTQDGRSATCPEGVFQTTVAALTGTAGPEATYPAAVSPSWKAPTSGGPPAVRRP